MSHGQGGGGSRSGGYSGGPSELPPVAGTPVEKVEASPAVAARHTLAVVVEASPAVAAGGTVAVAPDTTNPPLALQLLNNHRAFSPTFAVEGVEEP